MASARALVVQLAAPGPGGSGPSTSPVTGVAALGARGAAVPLRRPGAEGPGQEADRVDPVAPLVAGGRPGQADERHEVGRQRLGRVVGAGPGLGERHDGLLDRDEVGAGLERLGQSPAAGSAHSDSGSDVAGADVPAGDEAVADRPVRRPRPVDDCAGAAQTPSMPEWSGPCRALWLLHAA